MDILVLDAGNTSIKARRLTVPEQWPTPPRGDSAAPVPLDPVGSHPTGGGDEMAAWLMDLVARASSTVVLVSVVPAVTDLVRRTLPAVAIADHLCKLPFVTDISDLAAVGPDRICNVVAACGAGMDDALVVDAGTATTFDVLVGGVFKGGIIAPGMALAAAALAERAARLPEVPLADAPLVAATDTATAMAAGAWHAGRGGVTAIVEGLRRRHGDLPVVVTGGLGVHIADLGWHDPDWTLRGAAWLEAGTDRPNG